MTDLHHCPCGGELALLDVPRCVDHERRSHLHAPLARTRTPSSRSCSAIRLLSASFKGGLGSLATVRSCSCTDPCTSRSVGAAGTGWC